MLHLENTIPSYHVTSAADVIKETMEYYNVAPSDLAARLGITPKYMLDILCRKEYITTRMASRIEAVMGISSRLLLNLDSSYLAHHTKDYSKYNGAHTPHKFMKKYAWA